MSPAIFGLFKKKTEEALKPTREAWFKKVAHLFSRPSFDEGLWAELEELLISADVGVSTTAKLVEQAKQRLKTGMVSDTEQVRAALKEEMIDILDLGMAEPFPSSDGLSVILVIGVNGTGKTTSIAKLAHELKGNGKRVLLAASDTFRAAAIDQLQLWGERIGVDVIAHQPGGDPGAVAFDALEAAKKRQADFLLIDTAGRLHTKFNLMEELKKIRRVVTKADIIPETLLVLDATSGQNGLSQARYFTEAVTVSGVFLAKLDSTAKGGIVLAICDQLKIPILFIGTGQELEHLAPFRAREFVEALLSP
jgi:fused signal recognition particle receptor